MARKAKEANGSGEGSAGVGHNGLGEKGKGFVERIERLQKDKASLKGTFMADCKAVNEDINVVLGEAKDAGIPKKAIKAVLKARELQRKLDDAREDLDIADRDTFDNIRLALGDLADLPLGQAATAAAAGAAEEQRSAEGT